MKKSKPPGLEDIEKSLQHLSDALKHAEDSICAVVGTAFVDHYLGALLSKYFIDSQIAESLLDSQGATGNLATKAKFAYAVGLISKGCFQAIETVARIRNEFAHKLNVSRFDGNGGGASDNTVSELCKTLRPPLGLQIDVPITLGADGPTNIFELLLGQTYSPTNRGHFELIVSTLCVTLNAQTLVTSKSSRREDGWDAKAEPQQ